MGEWRFEPDEWPDPAGDGRRAATSSASSSWSRSGRRSTRRATTTRRWSGAACSSRNERGPRRSTWRSATGAPTGPSSCASTTRPTPRRARYLWDKICRRLLAATASARSGSTRASPRSSPDNAETARYHAGPGSEVGNLYPREHARGFYEGLSADGETDVVLLCRSAWAGSQRYGAARVVRRHRVDFEALRRPDPGRSQHRDLRDPLVDDRHRRLPRTATRRRSTSASSSCAGSSSATFCPLFRLHGFREPETGVGPSQTGGRQRGVVVRRGGVRADPRSYLLLRERLRPYVLEQMAAAHATGLPPMRPLFLEFPDEEPAWEVSDEYMFGRTCSSRR